MSEQNCAFVKTLTKCFEPPLVPSKTEGKHNLKQLKSISKKLCRIIKELQNDCDVNEVVITQATIGSTGFVISEPGKYCLAEYIVYTNTTVPAITIASNYVYLDLNGYTINLNSTGFAGIFIAPNISNVFIDGGSIVNSPRADIPSGNIHLLNTLVYGSTTAKGFGIAIGSQASNIIINDIETDHTFVGIGTLDGGQSNIVINDSQAFHFGFDYGVNDFRGAGFSFAAPIARTSPTTRIYNLVIMNSQATSLTGQNAIALYAVANGFVSNTLMQTWFNQPLAVPGAPETSAEETRGIGVLACDEIVVDTCNTINCRNPISIQNSNSCVVRNCVSSRWSRQGITITNSPFPTLNVVPLNGLAGQENTALNSIVKLSIANPNPANPVDGNGPDRGLGIGILNCSNNIVDNCNITAVLTGLFQAGIAIFNPGPAQLSTQNIVRNSISSHNTNGLLINDVVNIRNHIINNIFDYNTTAGVSDVTSPNDNLYEMNTANFNGPTNAQSANYSAAVRPVVNTTIVANSFTNPVAYYANRTNATVGAANVP